MKSLLFIMPSLKGGGAEKVLIDLFRHLPDDKYNVSLLIADFNGVYVNQIPENVEVIKLPQPTGLIASALLRVKPLRNLVWRTNIRKAIGCRKFDAIISFCEGGSTIYHSFIMDNGVRNISWVHMNLALNNWCSFMFGKDAVSKEKQIYSRMDSIVFVSDGAKESFRELFGITDGLHTIYNVIDRDLICSRADEFNVEKRKFTVCNIGRLDYQKRQDRLLEVTSILKKRGLDFEVWILGIGKWEDKLRNLARELGVEDCVKFLGFQTNPYPYLKASDVFLLTSDTEGYPTVVCESLCLGKPVISTSITGSEELLKDGVGVLTSYDVNEIADSVEVLMNNPLLLKKYSSAAEEKAKSFNPSEIIKQIDDLI